MHFLLRFGATVAAVLLTINLVPGIHITKGWLTILLAALVWSIMVEVIRPVLHVLTFPITMLTFGLFSFVLNALLFWALTIFVPGFIVDGFWSAMLGAVVISLLTWLIRLLL